MNRVIWTLAAAVLCGTLSFGQDQAPATSGPSTTKSADTGKTATGTKAHHKKHHKRHAKKSQSQTQAPTQTPQ